MPSKTLTIEEQMAAELEELRKQYEPCPPYAMTFQQVRAKYPDVPEKVLRQTLERWVETGKWKKTQTGRGHASTYWKVE